MESSPKMSAAGKEIARPLTGHEASDKKEVDAMVPVGGTIAAGGGGDIRVGTLGVQFSTVG
jgi:hypothetical protein